MVIFIGELTVPVAHSNSLSDHYVRSVYLQWKKEDIWMKKQQQSRIKIFVSSS